jgi:1-aminocyclopropane-1-carboxylate deaminase/D-cysteine desulfhydrase-like pyridoxal-dependent ACC family enzyme
MRSLLQSLDAVSDALNRPVYAWREDSYWAMRDGPQPEYAGGKMRMFDYVWWGGSSVKRVCTTGVVQSNQVRQLALYMHAHDKLRNIPMFARVAPDKGRVDFSQELTRGNLKLATTIHKNTIIEVMEEASPDTNRRIDEWMNEARRDPHAIVLPRGMACREGIVATTEMGNDILREADILPGRTLIVTVSGSGSTHIGLQRAIEKIKTFSVLGLSTKCSQDKQQQALSKNAPGLKLTVNDSFSVDGGGASDSSDAAVDRWKDIMGFEVDRQYCGRLCQFLDAISCSPTKDNFAEYSSIILVVTGLQVPQP